MKKKSFSGKSLSEEYIYVSMYIYNVIYKFQSILLLLKIEIVVKPV